MADLSVPENQRPAAGSGGGRNERVADADRDRTVTQLREHVVEGRLTLDEFSERVGLALKAKTRGELDAVMVDLPATQPPPTTTEIQPTRSGARRWHVAFMSGHSTKGRWRIGGKTTAVAVMGGCDLDLRRAQIDGPEVEITAVAFWGGVEIIVPEGFDVELRGLSIMGGRSLRLRDVPIVPGSPRIVIHGFAVMGGIEVKSRPNRSGSARSVGPTAVPELPSLPGRPGDMAALGRDLRRELREQRHAERHGHRHGGMPERGPAAQAQPADGTVTILFCDMVDYAGMTERLGDQASRRVLHEHHRIVREALTRHGGREISVLGDGFMIAFGGAARALRCAVDIQRAFDSFVPADIAEPIAVHIGVHTGDAVVEGDDYLGHTVIVASRLADAAGPGEILVSSISEQLVQGSGEFDFDGHRETNLKGLTRPQPSATLLWAG